MIPWLRQGLWHLGASTFERSPAGGCDHLLRIAGRSLFLPSQALRFCPAAALFPPCCSHSKVTCCVTQLDEGVPMSATLSPTQSDSAGLLPTKPSVEVTTV